MRQCLKGVFRYPPNANFEVIIVDNNSHDGTHALIADEFPQVTFRELEQNLGYAKGSNIGLSLAKGKFVLFLNADVVVLPDALDRLLAYATQHPGVGAVGPALHNPDGSIQDSAYDFHSFLTPVYQRTMLGRTTQGRADINRFLLRHWNHQSDRNVAWLMSSCLLVRRAALQDIGVFDERFFVYLADTDLCRRLWLKGWQVRYAADVSFVHYHRRQSADDWRAALTHIIDWSRYLRKWHGQSLPAIVDAPQPRLLA